MKRSNAVAMDKAEKLVLIARFEAAVDPLIEFVKAAPAPAIDFRPVLPGAWTIREHAVHFLDADAFAHGRLRLSVAEPGTTVLVWNQEAWRAQAQYQTADSQSSLEIARALRTVSAAMARALVDRDWEAYFVLHPERGRLNLADLFKIYIDHAQSHLEYFRRNLKAFSGGNG